MKNSFFLVSVLLSFSLSAQTPDGKLFIQLGSSNYQSPKTLGYIEYPQEQYIFIDSVNITDMIISENSLFVASDNIYEYDLSTNQKIDSIENSQAFQIKIWENYLIVKSLFAPYISAYDINNNSLDFYFDTTQVAYCPADFTIFDDKAFLVFNNTVQILDLLSQDTIASVQTPHPFQFGGMNYFIFEIDGEIYIDVEYATGAPRFSLIKMNPQNYLVETLFHQEMAYNPWKPIVGDNIIYISHFPSYYDILLDTMISATWGSSFAIDYDPISNSVFEYELVSKQLKYHYNGISSTPIVFTTDLYLTMFYSGQVQNIQIQPENLIACENQTSWFFIVAENAQTFQWQENSGSGFYDIVNSTNYDGATSDSLSISNTSIIMDGNQYRCIISDSSGMDTSNFANLSVFPSPQSFSISGVQNVFESQTETYSAPFDANLIYEWNVENGVLLNQISSDSIVVQWGISGVGIISAVAINAYDCRSDSSFLNISIGINSIENNMQQQKIKIYPNPTSSGFLNISKSKNQSIEIYNNIGSPILFSNAKIINTSNLQSGLYFILVKNKNGEILKFEKLLIYNH
ncbi:MAG: T9SS type A sorting domain-containing protein [Bacteroidetes bacterium]|jgi:hypothetical protein|nr:T9SS type A sorting domain-containing protein [Bacteroidota bacterium]MBT6688099.1 T9SS type A sorting domain-containing protein [Bacteroidota bacterium]MBT7143704.1 T9SS type A sorting domain-containing protein [Bacteroidota bacterium]MBT7490390.1 T9SS type A sorting domain-containing protein [Bacteroidota bacterium]